MRLVFLLARESAARTAAEAANRAKDDFFLTLSHELRGPLNAILSWVYLLRAGELDEAVAARALETIERSAKAEGRLIGDMLDVSRMIGSRIHLILGPVNLATLVAETVETVRPEIDKGVIHVEIDSPHPIGSINADPNRLRQVMENLLLNAIKFTPKGGQITVRLRYEAQCATITAATPVRAFARTFSRMSSNGSGRAIPPRRVSVGSGSRSWSTSSNCTAAPSGRRVKARGRGRRSP